MWICLKKRGSESVLCAIWVLCCMLGKQSAGYISYYKQEAVVMHKQVYVLIENNEGLGFSENQGKSISPLQYQSKEKTSCLSSMYFKSWQVNLSSTFGSKVMVYGAGFEYWNQVLEGQYIFMLCSHVSGFQCAFRATGNQMQRQNQSIVGELRQIKAKSGCCIVMHLPLKDPMADSG